MAPEAIYFRDEQERPPLQKAVDAYNIAVTEILVKTHPRGLLESALTFRGSINSKTPMIMAFELQSFPLIKVMLNSNNPRG